MKSFGVPPMAAWIELWEHIIQSLPCVRGGGSYGGIAAEIGAKNMPPACFFNAPTEGENKRLKFSPPVSLPADSPLTEGAKDKFPVAIPPPSPIENPCLFPGFAAY